MSTALRKELHEVIDGLDNEELQNLRDRIFHPNPELLASLARSQQQIREGKERPVEEAIADLRQRLG